MFGRVFEDGLTPLPGPDGSLIAELGYGPLGSDPRFDGGASFTYGDLDGAGSGPDLAIDPDNLGLLTVSR